MPRRPEIGNVQLYPSRPLTSRDKGGYKLQFYCPIQQARVRRACGTRDRREARRIQRECQERLLNGQYVESGGAITASMESAVRRPRGPAAPDATSGSISWQDAYDRYREHKSRRIREGSLTHALSRLNIAERVFNGYREDRGLPEGFSVSEVMTLDMLEYLQDRLLAGDECRYDVRSRNTVNSIMAGVMTFVRFCRKREWISNVPDIEKLDVDEVMKGRPITLEEFEQMIEATPKVVGNSSAESWQFALRILWESGFRVGDLMDFSWDDKAHLHPSWPSQSGQLPTIIIPSSQKNKRVQEIPLLPGVEQLLGSVPESKRCGWVVNPLPIQYEIKAGAEWFQPRETDLRSYARKFSNQSIAKACGVSETTVRNWLKKLGVQRDVEFQKDTGEIPESERPKLRGRAQRRTGHTAQRTEERLSKEHVGRVVSMIGEEAGIVVRHKDSRLSVREKFASSHDIRRGCAVRLINMGISAETLKIIMRHEDFATTEKHYGAMRSAQAAGNEVRQKLTQASSDVLVGRLVGHKEAAPDISQEELRALKSLLERL